MQKKRYGLFLFLLLSLSLVGCAGMADYSYEVGDDYELWRTSAHEIHVIPKDGWQDKSEIIPAKVVRIAWDEQFVIAEQQLLQRRSSNDPTDSYKEPSEDFAYWILDTTAKKAHGPFVDEEVLKMEMERMKIPLTLKLKDVESFRE